MIPLLYIYLPQVNSSMTTHLEQLYNRLKGSCPELVGKGSRGTRTCVKTTGQTFRVGQVDPTMFACNQSILKLKNPCVIVDNMYESAIINFFKTKEPSHETNDFLIFLWCWKDWHKNKKFDWPIVIQSNFRSSKSTYNTYGAKHRLNVALIYNMIFGTTYTVETIGEKFIDGPLYNKPVSKFVTSTNKSVTPSDPYPIVEGHRVNISARNIYERESVIAVIEQCESFDLQFNEVTAKQLNTIFDTDFFKVGSKCIDITLHDHLFEFIERYASHDNKPMIDAMSAGIFSCILLKIPVESKYFSLKL